MFKNTQKVKKYNIFFQENIGKEILIYMCKLNENCKPLKKWYSIQKTQNVIKIYNTQSK